MRVLRLRSKLEHVLAGLKQVLARVEHWRHRARAVSRALCRRALCRVVGVVRVAQHCVHTVHLAQFLEKRYQVQELGVRHVVEPRSDRHLQKSLHTDFIKRNKQINIHVSRSICILKSAFIIF